MRQAIDPTTILFLDIECVSGEEHWSEISPALQELWRQKAQRLQRSDEELDAEQAAAAYQDRAAIYAEFGKVVCISVGYVRSTADGLQMRVKSFCDPEERVVLQQFAGLMESPSFQYFCGHNIREFDIPYLCRRMLVHGMPLPGKLDLRGCKPWEVKHLLDTMELWCFGDRKAFTSLKLLAAIFGVPSPKDDIDGSQVGRVFWEENDLERIARYCEKDVVATANVYFAMHQMPLLSPDQVTTVSAA